MIRCKPKGLCSWSFFLDGEGHHASLSFNHLWSEQGEITADDTSFKVSKQGVLSAQWTLLQDGQQVATAQKTNIFTRTFNIQNAQGSLLLRAVSPFSRRLHLESPDDVIAEIASEHALTRRATIEIYVENYDFTTIAFAFWMVALSWRRATNNNAG